MFWVVRLSDFWPRLLVRGPGLLGRLAKTIKTEPGPVRGYVQGIAADPDRPLACACCAVPRRRRPGPTHHTRTRALGTMGVAPGSGVCVCVCVCVCAACRGTVLVRTDGASRAPRAKAVAAIEWSCLVYR
jgi:hypothetical protein